MKLQTLFEEKKVVFSLEIFPPKKTSSIQTIYDTLDALRDIEPDFISVTYGAGGNPADRSTVQIASDIKHRYHIEPLAHLSCVNSTKEHIGRVLDDLRENDIENILALRGDLNPNVPPQTDYRYASDLIDDIKQYGGFDIAAACYPEVHPEAADLEEDLLHLKEKVAAGATHLISQLFFDNNDYYNHHHNHYCHHRIHNRTDYHRADHHINHNSCYHHRNHNHHRRNYSYNYNNYHQHHHSNNRNDCNHHHDHSGSCKG